MIRRQRRTREIAFSFDSFLDVVANVVGIIIRLILVAWVGARSYKSVDTVTLPPAAPAKPLAAAKEPTDPLQEELAQHRRELAEIQARLLEQLRQCQEVRDGQLQIKGQLDAAVERQTGLSREKEALTRIAAVKNQTAGAVALSLQELKEHRRKLLKEIEEVEKMPALKKVLRYRTPVSRPVQAEEFLFECRNGRVTFVDIGSFLVEVRQGLEEKAQALHATWQVGDITSQVGAFRLRYVIERDRTLSDGILAGSSPDTHVEFRYGLSEWVIEPVAEARGETLAEALAEGSQFRQVVDHIDPQEGVVTFCVYPESFALYRQLRDYLYERDLTVAGRPLPEGIPIASSRHGSISRGQ